MHSNVEATSSITQSLSEIFSPSEISPQLVIDHEVINDKTSREGQISRSLFEAMKARGLKVTPLGIGEKSARSISADLTQAVFKWIDNPSVESRRMVRKLITMAETRERGDSIPYDMTTLADARLRPDVETTVLIATSKIPKERAAEVDAFIERVKDLLYATKYKDVGMMHLKSVMFGVELFYEVRNNKLLPKIEMKGPPAPPAPVRSDDDTLDLAVEAERRAVKAEGRAAELEAEKADLLSRAEKSKAEAEELKVKIAAMAEVAESMKREVETLRAELDALRRVQPPF